jgi:hypothetical protein
MSVSLRHLSVAAIVVLTCSSSCGAPSAPPGPRVPALPEAPPGELRNPEAFAVLTDRDARARALFLEATRVMFHPRCRNCHPDGDSPAQGDAGRLHDPPVLRGPEDRGIAALACTSCHQDRNVELARVPGAPEWHLAPRAMAWVNRTPHALCEQLKDPARNGGRSLEQIVEHSTHDALVGWGWAPGSGRAPAPGSQARFGALMSAWRNDGAACPAEEQRR